MVKDLTVPAAALSKVTGPSGTPALKASVFSHDLVNKPIKKMLTGRFVVSRLWGFVSPNTLHLVRFIH